jgi:hypothetical protein
VLVKAQARIAVKVEGMLGGVREVEKRAAAPVKKMKTVLVEIAVVTERELGTTEKRKGRTVKPGTLGARLVALEKYLAGGSIGALVKALR